VRKQVQHSIQLQLNSVIITPKKPGIIKILGKNHYYAIDFCGNNPVAICRVRTVSPSTVLLTKNEFADYPVKPKVPFYILTSNPQIIRGNMKNWKLTRYGHASKRKGNTRINKEIRSSLSRNE